MAPEVPEGLEVMEYMEKTDVLGLTNPADATRGDSDTRTTRGIGGSVGVARYRGARGYRGSRGIGRARTIRIYRGDAGNGVTRTTRGTWGT